MKLINFTRQILISMVVFFWVSGEVAQAEVISADLAISHVNVISLPGPVLLDQTVLIQNSKIIYVGPDLKFKAARTIEGRGRYLMPGLIDVHVHISGREVFNSETEYMNWVESGLKNKFKDYLRYGFTTILSVGDYWPAVVKVRDRVRDGKILAPNLYVSGPIIAPVNGHGIGDNPSCQKASYCANSKAIAVDTVNEARELIVKLSESGVDGIKIALQDPVTQENTLGYVIPGKSNFGSELPLERIVGHFNLGVLETLIDEAHAHGLPVRAHTGTATAGLEVIDAGVDALVHGPGVADGLVSSNTFEEVLDAAKLHNIPLATTASVGSIMTDYWGTERAVVNGVTEYIDFLKAKEVRHPLSIGLRSVLDRGLVLAFGTDSMFMPRVLDPARFELKSLYDNGLSPEEVLSVMTINGAKYLNRENDIGSVKEGKIADLILIAGNPLIIHDFLDRIDVTIKGGEIVWEADFSD